MAHIIRSEKGLGHIEHQSGPRIDLKGHVDKPEHGTNRKYLGDKHDQVVPTNAKDNTRTTRVFVRCLLGIVGGGGLVVV